MQIAKNLVLASVAALTLAGGAGLALARPMHSITVTLPDGGLAQIRYFGDVPPQVAFVPEQPMAEYDSLVSPLATLGRISMQMDREMDALMGDVAMAPPLSGPGAMLDAAMRAPAGAAQYSVVSTVGGDGDYCMRSMEVTRASPGAQPHVVTHMSGNCRSVDVGGVRFGAALAPRRDVAPPAEIKAWPVEKGAGPKLLTVAYQPTR